MSNKDILPVAKDIYTPKPVFKPSQNWASLQKSFAQQPSKKRKRNLELPFTTVKPKKIKNLTTYNPWRPNASQSRRTGNTALMQLAETGDKLVKYSYPTLDRFLLT